MRIDAQAPGLAGDGHAGTRPAPVLIVLHQEHSTSGHIGRLLLERGHPLDIRRPRGGEPLPETLRDHAGAVVFGGPMSANDSDDYMRREHALVELALKEDRPYLGVCLGAQIMSIVLGGTVAPHPQAHVEIGYHALDPLETATIGGEWPRVVYQWHREGFDVPGGSIALAEAGGPFANQAFQYGRTAFGLQFHPEISFAMVARWSARSEHKLDATWAYPRARQLEDHVRHAPAVLGWLDRFLGEWVALGQLAEAPAAAPKRICNSATDQV